MPKVSDLPERLASRISVDPSTGCWNWSGAKFSNGYGFTRLGGRVWLTHRLAWSVLVCDPGEAMVVDHVCRNRACCNPAHLRAVDRRTNALENSVGRAAVNHSKTHCSNGHEFTPENTRIRWDRSGNPTWRCCIACHRNAARESYARKRGQP